MISTGRSARNCAASKIPPTSGACCTSSASASSPPSRPRPKAASSACGARCKIASSANCAFAGLSTLEDANAFLPTFLPDFIRRFARAPADTAPAWRPAPRPLEHILSCRYERRVAKDNTVALGPRWVQIPPGPRARSYAGCHVTVRELLDGRLVVSYQETIIATLPSPGPHFVFKPRSDPGRDRRRHPYSTRLRPSGERPGAPQRRDRPGGRYLGIPQNGQNLPSPPPASSSTPVPNHPWRTTFSRRQRRRQAAARRG